MMSRLTKRAAIGLLLVALSAVPLTAATRVTVAAGPWGGIYFLVGTALAHLLSNQISGTTAVAEPVTGSAHGLELIHSGEATIGLVSLATAQFGVRGQREFSRKLDDVAFVMAAMDTGQSLVTLPNSGIKTFADVKQLRIAANTESSRALLLAALRPYGVREGDVKLSLMSYTEQLDALRQHTLDAAFIALAPYNAELGRFAAAQPIRILGLDAARAKSFEEQPSWVAVALRAGAYPGQDQDLLVPGSHTALLAHKEADPALIYKITRAIAEHNREFGDLHPGGREFNADKTRYFVEHHLLPVAFHPGAERYWREHGVLK